MDNDPTNIKRQVHWWPMLIGVYFAFRISISFLWFSDDAVMGSAVTGALELILLVVTTVYSVEKRPAQGMYKEVPNGVKWIGAYLGLALISLLWTETQSYVAALVYLSGLYADVLIVWLLIRGRDVWPNSIMSGFVCGMSLVALIAWVSPTTADGRLGNDEFMHPNLLGWNLALATLLSQYLASEQRMWRWAAIGLGITQIRTLSKTSLIAFTIAETFYLLNSYNMRRRTRIYIGTCATIIIVMCWGWLEAYAEAYATEGNSLETLTGRTILWSSTLSIALEEPWLGHGFHSFRALIPPLGAFEPWHAHNELLQQFFIYGLVGVLIAFGVYWKIFRQAYHSMPSELRTLALSILFMSLIRGLTDTDRFDLTFPLWLITLLAFSLAKEKRCEHA
jgi:exopolysaccharide production protein ExoQ